MQSTLNEPDSETWSRLAPLLDDAMAELGETDRTALVLRFFENKTAREIAEALRMEEAAAQKRVTRALEKLRAVFVKRGVTLTATFIAGAVAANSVQAAPVGLVVTVTAAAIKGAAVGSSTLTLVKGALKFMAWTKVKTAVVVSLGVLLTAGTATVVTTTFVKKFDSLSADAIYEEIWALNSNSVPLLEKAPPAVIIRPTRYPTRSGGSYVHDDGKQFWVNGSLTTLLGTAYGYWPAVRTVMPGDLPGGNYDMINSLPKGQNTAALKAEIQKQFGLIANVETRDADVFTLKVKDAGKLKAHLSTDGKSSTGYSSANKVLSIYFKNEPLKNVANLLENYFEKPLVNQSDSADRYNFTFQWTSNVPADLVEKVRNENVRKSLRDELDQFGLELVPTNMPIALLVVEREK